MADFQELAEIMMLLYDPSICDDFVNKHIKKNQMGSELELILRVITKSMPQNKVDIVYAFAESADNQESAFGGVLTFRNKIDEPKPKVIISKAQEGYGYPGFNSWSTYFGEIIGMENVAGVPIDVRINTQIESQALLRYCTQQGYTDIAVVAAPLHHLRAYVTLVSEIIKDEVSINAFSLPGLVQPWDEEVEHSQGTLRGTRAELLVTELDKIFNVYKNIISFDELLNYIDSLS